MLPRIKSGVCVAPLLPSPTLRAVAIGPQVGTGKQAHQSNWKAEFAVALLGAPVMHFYSGPPMHLFSGVDTGRSSIPRAAQ